MGRRDGCRGTGSLSALLLSLRKGHQWEAEPSMAMGLCMGWAHRRASGLPESGKFNQKGSWRNLGEESCFGLAFDSMVNCQPYKPCARSGLSGVLTFTPHHEHRLCHLSPQLTPASCSLQHLQTSTSDTTKQTMMLLVVQPPSQQPGLR